MSSIDINECLTIDCGNGTCYNSLGSYACSCNLGYLLVANATPVCQGLYYFTEHYTTVNLYNNDIVDIPYICKFYV